MSKPTLAMNCRSLIRWCGKSPTLFLLVLMVFGFATHTVPSGWTCRLVAAEPARKAGFSANIKLRKALAKVVDLELVESPLKHAVTYIGELAGVPIRLEIQNAEYLEVDEETPITFKFKKVRIDVALDRLLSDLHLGWKFDGDAFVVTSAEVAGKSEIAVIYDVSDFFSQPLVQSKVADQIYGHNVDPLISLLTQFAAPETWPIQSGPAPIDSYQIGKQVFLVARLSRYTHRAIQATLDSFRRALPTDDREPPLVIFATAEQVQHEQFAAKLRKVVDVDFDATPLIKALEVLLARNNVSFSIDARSLALLGVSMDVPVTSKRKGLSIARQLELVLEPLELSSYQKGDILQVTSPETECGAIHTVFYNVDDLLRHAEVGNVRFSTNRLAAAEKLSRLILRTVEIESWEEVGGAGTIEPEVLAGRVLLIVRHDNRVHKQIQSLLQRLIASLPAVPQVGSDDSKISIRVYPLHTDQRWHPDQIEQIVRAAVEPASWNEEASLTVAAGIIVAKQTKSAHAEIEQLLFDLDVLKRKPTCQLAPRATDFVFFGICIMNSSCKRRPSQ